jgi:hypothetical protein
MRPARPVSASSENLKYCGAEYAGAALCSKTQRRSGERLRIPSAILVAAAAILALPFGCGFGVLLAYIVAGTNFGQLPALTVPISIVAAMVFAFTSSVSAHWRLAVMAGGAAAFVAWAFAAASV